MITGKAFLLLLVLGMCVCVCVSLRECCVCTCCSSLFFTCLCFHLVRVHFSAFLFLYLFLSLGKTTAVFFLLVPLMCTFLLSHLFPPSVICVFVDSCASSSHASPCSSNCHGCLMIVTGWWGKLYPLYSPLQSSLFSQHIHFQMLFPLWCLSLLETRELLIQPTGRRFRSTESLSSDRKEREKQVRLFSWLPRTTSGCPYLNCDMYGYLTLR